MPIDYTKIVYAIDYDGVLDGRLDDDYLKDFLEHIKNNLEAYPEAVHELRVGSFRNTRYINAVCEKMNRNGCCFTFMVNFLHKLHKRFPEYAARITLNKMLVEDVENGQPFGTNFDEGLMLARTTHPKERLICQSPAPRVDWHDELKQAQLYLQIQDAHQNIETQKTLFMFFDDRLDILNTIRFFFGEQHPNWLPRGVTLQLHHVVAGQFIASFMRQTGLGLADPHYRETVKFLRDPLVESVRQGLVVGMALQMANTLRPYELIKKLIIRDTWSNIVDTIAKIPDDKRRKILYDALLRADIERDKYGNVSQLCVFGVDLSVIYHNQTPIQFAAEQRRWRCVEKLSQNPTDANDHARYGVALLIVAENAQFDLALHLIKQIPTPKHRLYSEVGGIRSILLLAVQNKKYDLLAAALEGQDFSDPAATSLYEDAVRFACRDDDAEAVRYLLPYHKKPLELLCSIGLFSQERDAWDVFTFVFDDIRRKALFFSKEQFIALFFPVIQKRDPVLLRALIAQYQGLSDKEKNLLIVLSQHYMTYEAVSMISKVQLCTMLNMILGVVELAQVDITLYQFCVQLCSLPGDGARHEEILVLFLLFSRALKESSGTIKFLLYSLMGEMLLSSAEMKTLQHEMSSFALSDDKTPMIIKIHEGGRTYQRIMESRVDFKSPAEAMDFIVKHKGDEISDDDVARCVASMAVLRQDRTALLIALDEKIASSNGDCTVAYRALRSAIFYAQPKDQAELMNVIACWKRAPITIFSNKNNETVLRESDAMHEAGQYCSLFVSGQHKSFLKNLMRFFSPVPAASPAIGC